MRVGINIKIEYDSLLIPSIHDIMKEGISLINQYLKVVYYNDINFPDVHYILKGISSDIPNGQNELVVYSLTENTPPTLNVLEGEVDVFYVGILMAALKPYNPKIYLINIT